MNDTTDTPTGIAMVPVHPMGLIGGDRLLRDPDAPEREIDWRIGHVELTATPDGDRLVIAEYVTEDGTEGRHGFEDQSVWLTVAVRTPAPSALPLADPAEAAGEAA